VSRLKIALGVLAVLWLFVAIDGGLWLSERLP